MEIFKYRHLALGLGVFLVSLYISYYLSNALKIALLFVFLLASTTVILIYILKKNKGTPDIFIRCILVFLFISLAMIISLLSFSKEKKAMEYLGEDEHIVYGEIVERKYEEGFENAYIIKTEKIDEDSFKAKAVFICYNESLKIGDRVEAKAKISMLENTPLSNERSYYLDDGIFLEITASEYSVLEAGDDKEGVLKRLNSFLSNRFYKYLNGQTASLFSSLLLGNDQMLDSGVKRDFSRIGISHILALSGLHITILTFLVGFILKLLRLPLIVKNLIIVSFTGFFVALTGFSDSAVRAGIMACLVCVLSLIGFSVDTITSLFLSVSLICLVSPYSIFSVSLVLSFLAMLGCIVGFKFAKRLEVKFKSKIVKNVIYSLITSMFVFGFTLPMIMIKFSKISLLTPVTNILIAPIFTILIYFAPFVLGLLGIPFVTNIIEYLSEQAVNLTINIVRYIASLEGIVMPISNMAQKISVAIIIIFLILLLFFKRRSMWVAFLGVFIGGVSFFVGSLSLYVDRQTNTYISTSSYKTNDYIFLENKNDLSVIDISSTTSGNYKALDYAISSLNYSEIENYIICDYSHLTDKYFEKIAKGYKLETLYIQAPTNENEEKTYKEIEKIALNEKINIKIIEKAFNVSDFSIEFSEKDTLSRSEKRCVSLSIKANNCEALYLGSASYEIFDKFTENKAKTADIIIFGTYGPTYKVKYNYNTPYLDLAIFSDESYSWASEEMKSELEGMVEYIKVEPLRIRIKE